MFDDPWKIKMLSKDVGIFTEKGGTIAFMLSKKGIVVVEGQRSRVEISSISV